MTVTLSRISDLPHVLRDGGRFAQRLAGRRPTVFLDYDGTLTPIVANFVLESIGEVERFLNTLAL